MTNIIRLEVKTNSSYSEAEKVELLDTFVEFIGEADGDIVEDSESVIIVDEDDDTDNISDAKKQEIVKEWLDEAEITAVFSLTNGWAMEAKLTVD